MTELLPELNLPLKAERQVLFWFKANMATEKKYLAPHSLPVYIWEFAHGNLFYGFPDLGDGIKVAHHHAGELTTPHTLNRKISKEEVRYMQGVIGKHFNINFDFNYATACMYTNTPDEDFIIDYYPDNHHIIVASPCSGHGFKFVSYTGKILNDMAIGSNPELDITMFGLSRFGRPKQIPDA